MILNDNLEEYKIKDIFVEIYNGNNKLRENIIISNLKLVPYRIKRLYYKDSYEYEELFQVGTIGLIKAVDTYNINKNIKFSTYACACIDNEINMYLKRKNKEQIISLNSIDEINIPSEILVEDNLFKQIEIDELWSSIKKLSPKEQYILTHIYGLKGETKYTEVEIAKNLGISQSSVSSILLKALKKLRMLILNIKFTPNNKKTSLYDFFKEYSHQEIDLVLELLNEHDKFCALQFNQKKLTKEERKKFYNVIAKIRIRLENIAKGKDISSKKYNR